MWTASIRGLILANWARMLIARCDKHAQLRSACAVVVTRLQLQQVCMNIQDRLQQFGFRFNQQAAGLPRAERLLPVRSDQLVTEASVLITAVGHIHSHYLRIQLETVILQISHSSLISQLTYIRANLLFMMNRVFIDSIKEFVQLQSYRFQWFLV